MSSLVEKIQDDLKLAMKSKNSFDLSVLRMLITALKNKKIELVAKDGLDDGQAVAVVKSEVKKRQDAAALYDQGGRAELAEKERAEIEVLKRYLPEQMDEQTIEKIVKEVVAGFGEAGPGDFGKVMGSAMAKLKGRADGKTVQDIVKRVLGA